MRKAIALTTVLFLFSAFYNLRAESCDPCSEAIPSPCDASCSGCSDGSVFRLFRGGSRLKISGSVEGTIRVNEYGRRSRYENGEHIAGNGDVFGGANGSTNFNVSQLWLSMEREMDCSKGFDWGAKADLVFGMDGDGFQKYHDRSFDHDWGTGDYAWGFNNLKMLFGYKKLTVEAGLFETYMGWEGPKNWDNFFVSGALVNEVMPTSHIGFMANYELSDRLTISGGWSNGYDNGQNRFNDSAFVGAFEFQLNDVISIAYACSIDKMNDGRYSDGSFRYGDDYLGKVDAYVHSLDVCFEFSDRFYYMLEWALSNWKIRNNGVRSNLSGYGLNNYFVYTLNDKWSFGSRIEWFHDGGISLDPSNYYEVSLGLNWTPLRNIKIRPELRYDWVHGGAKPFRDNEKDTQLSSGLSLFARF